MTLEPLQIDFFGIADNVNAFLVLFIGLGALFGGISRKLSIAAFGGILVFVHISIETDLFIFDALLYGTLLVVFLWASRFIVNAYFNSNTGGVSE